MRSALAALLLAHGVAHLVGFVGAFQLSPTVPAPARLLGGVATLEGPALRAFGLFWLLLALSFAATAVGALLEAEWWGPTTFWLAAVSAALCVLGLPSTGFGLLFNAGLLALLTLDPLGLVALQRTWQ
jgi:hypothetical protein